MYRRKSVFCETSSSETVAICNSSLPILQHFSYIQLQSKGQKCPVSQMTDLYFAAKRGTSDLLAQTQYKNQHSIALHTRKSVRESEQTNHISSQSPKSLFRKNTGIFDGAQNYFRCFISCSELKIVTASCFFYEKCHTVFSKRELVSQNRDFLICILSTSAVLFLVQG